MESIGSCGAQGFGGWPSGGLLEFRAKGGPGPVFRLAGFMALELRV